MKSMTKLACAIGTLMILAALRIDAQPANLDAVLRDVEAAQVKLVNGDAAPFKALWSHGADVTAGWRVGRRGRQGLVAGERAPRLGATQYVNGSRTHEEVSRIVGTDLAYVVLRETIRFKNARGR